jgi:hypothetical protein
MNKKLRGWGIIALVMVAAFAFTGCSGGGLSGTWESDDDFLSMTWTFAGNKLTYEVMGMKVTTTYKVKNKAIAMEYQGASVEYAYTIDGDTLTIDMGVMPVKFRRVRN